MNESAMEIMEAKKQARTRVCDIVTRFCNDVEQLTDVPERVKEHTAVYSLELPNTVKLKKIVNA
jgi:benzoyl-CoA reductase/2-hydroxyglutaryl-CoA dehydratase subunit BcrC/BadD/HgdB